MVFCLQRAANTGWGADDQKGRWGHDKFDGPPRSDRKPIKHAQAHLPESTVQVQRLHDMCIGRASKGKEMMSDERDERRSRRHADEELETRDDQRQDKRFRSGGGDHFKTTSKDYERREGSKMKRYDDELSTHKLKEGDDRRKDKRLGWGNDDLEPRRKEGYDRREEKQSRRSTRDGDLLTHNRDRDDRKRGSGR